MSNHLLTLKSLLNQHQSLVEEQLKPSLDLSTALLTDKLQNTLLTQMSTNLQGLQRKVQPIATMAEKVHICRDNIELAMSALNKVTSNISR